MHNHSRELAVTAMFLCLGCALAGGFLGYQMGKSKRGTSTVTTTVPSTSTARLKISLTSTTCNESTQNSFHYKLSGPPLALVYMLVIGPDGLPYQNVAGSKGQPYGYIKLDKHGSYTSKKSWACWYGSVPGTPADAPGPYQIMFIDTKARLVSNVATFADVK